jgi:hypothetical protein
MSYEVTRYTGAGSYNGLARRASRAITARQMDGQVRLAGVDADTDVTISKLENITMATGAASAAVVRVAQAQRHLEQLVPEASARLAFLADDHILGCAEVLADLRRELRRR